MLYMGAVEGIILSVAVRVAGHASALYVCTYLYVFGIYSQLHYQLNLHTRKQLPRLLAWDRYIPGLWEHWRGFQWPVRRNFQAQSCWMEVTATYNNCEQNFLRAVWNHAVYHLLKYGNATVI